MTQSDGPLDRRKTFADDVETKETRRPWSGFYHIDERDFRFRRFDGRKTELLTRSTYVTGEAVCVLPYDPVRDRVMLVEQFRIAAHVRGDPEPWTIETPAGRLEAGEPPEDCARRETMEECGLHIQDLHRVAGFYPSVGGNTGYFHAFIGIADIPDSAAGTFGLEEEAEDIKAHILGFSEAMDLLENGQLNTGPLLLLLLWLEPRRQAFRQTA